MVNWQGKRVAVVGLGVSNLAVIQYLLPRQAVITACDKKTPEQLGQRWHQIKDYPIDFKFGADYLSGLEQFDWVFLAPGLPKELPEIKALANTDVTICSEMGLFLELNPASTVGITGSSGKTTTTTLIGRMLGKEKRTWVGGNIGTPLLTKIADIAKSDWVVLELSSFQLEIVDHAPDIAVVTNITPNHLDVHPSLEAYIAAKKRIWQFQSSEQQVVLNYDDPITRAMAESAPGQVYWFSRQREVDQGAFVRDGEIVLRNVPPAASGEKILCSVDDIRLVGSHNIENILAAAAASALAGVSLEALTSVITTFAGVPHRLEKVREIDGVKFYNDSIATSPSRAVAGLRAFVEPIILIAGGYDKNLPFDEFAQVIQEKAKAVVLLGAAAAKIEAAISSQGSQVPVYRVEALEQAVRLANDLASPGDVVLLSPACASYDMFQNFEERGDRFRELVGSLVRRIAE